MAVQIERFLQDDSSDEDAEVKIWFTIPQHLCGHARQCGACWDTDTQRWYAPNRGIADALTQLLRPPAQYASEPAARHLLGSLQAPVTTAPSAGHGHGNPALGQPASQNPAPEQPPPDPHPQHPPPHAPQPARCVSGADARVYYIVPFAEKDVVKALGCWWDKPRQAWFAPNAQVAAAVDADGRWLRAPATVQATAPAQSGSDTAGGNESGGDDRVFYDVPFAEKDDAKVIGMRYEKGRGWFARDAKHAAVVDGMGRWPRACAGTPAQPAGQVQAETKRNSTSQDDRVFYDVPFAEKDDVKALGCYYEKLKGWYAPNAQVAAAMDGAGRWARVDVATPVHLVGEDRSFGSGLYVDLIPETTWCKNARALIHKDDWHRVRMHVNKRVQGRCEACGVLAQDNGSRLECHERWQYKPPVQKLVRLVALCHECHQATHMGFANVSGNGDEAMQHLRKVTGMSSEQAREHVSKAGDVWLKRSIEQWLIDCSLLTRSGIKVNDKGWSASGR